jgi:hypothetical protein
MKNSKEYSKKIQNLYRSLKRAYPKVIVKAADSDVPGNQNIVQALVFGIVGEKFSQSETEAIIKKFNEYFVDLNDMRVARAEEVVELLGVSTAESLGVPATIQNCLSTIFNQYHKMSLDVIKKLGKRQARAALEKIAGLSCFVIDYCMLVSLDGHTIPLTEKMITYLKTNEIVAPDANATEIAGFLAKQISAKNGFEFYCLLRQESECHHPAESPAHAIQDSVAKPALIKRTSEGKSKIKKTTVSEKTKPKASKKNKPS